MTGYKLGDGNQFDIEYGLVVLRADGSQAYAEPQAAAQKEQTFYPVRYQPGVLSLNLAKDHARGQYTIVLKVRDNLGSQTYKARQKVSVEKSPPPRQQSTRLPTIPTPRPITVLYLPRIT